MYAALSHMSYNILTRQKMFGCHLGHIVTVLASAEQIWLGSTIASLVCTLGWKFSSWLLVFMQCVRALLLCVSCQSVRSAWNWLNVDRERREKQRHYATKTSVV